VIAGLGVDIVEIDRMRQALERRPKLKQRLFSSEEQAYCEERGRPEVHYALRFAAKEAVLKALGTGFSGMRFTDVEVVREPSGKPAPKLSGRAAEFAEEAGVVELHLSLSFTHTTAVASAVAITERARPKKQEKLDPRAELAAAFKEVRSVLDDVGSDAPRAHETVPSPDEPAVRSEAVGPVSGEAPVLADEAAPCGELP
jgi:holo-[acyl-carrier protein] synthase